MTVLRPLHRNTLLSERIVKSVLWKAVSVRGFGLCCPPVDGQETTFNLYYRTACPRPPVCRTTWANSRLTDNSTALLLVSDPSCRSQLSKLLISLPHHVHVRNTLVIVSFHHEATTYPQHVIPILFWFPFCFAVATDLYFYTAFVSASYFCHVAADELTSQNGGKFRWTALVYYCIGLWT